MANALNRLVYRSSSLIAADDIVQLRALLDTSVRNNRRDNITGCLAMPDGHFVHVIEGAKIKVSALMARISADCRHHNIEFLGEWPIEARLFQGWAMARPDVTPLSDQSFRIINQAGSGAQVTSILLTLTEQAEVLF